MTIVQYLYIMSELGKTCKELTPFEDRLLICKNIPPVSLLVEKIRTDRTGGEPLRQAMQSLGYKLAAAWTNIHSPATFPKQIVSIPRSGIPLAIGLTHFFPYSTYEKCSRSTDEKLTPPVLENNTSIFIADGVIVTGETMDTILRLLNRQDVPTTAFTTVSTVDGASYILAKFPKLTLVTGTLDTVAGQTWDVHRWKAHRTIQGMGNLGDLLSKP